MFKLKSYLLKNNITYAEFAASIGVTQTSIARYINKKRFPQPRIIKQIAKITDNYVSPSDWYQENFTTAIQEKATPAFVNGSTVCMKPCEQNEMLQSQYEEKNEHQQQPSHS
ncbi:helix-turn-helix domain-containing protein [Bartonella grahamii]|uniref:helix-turn-helix domain-containing protein n=1 Tax=Bartonella grahamii TaxID=33045 RepID=UPI001ABB9611|nr:helix-turn-helix transcriptional regulator [Bartonella grahamii]